MPRAHGQGWKRAWYAVAAVVLAFAGGAAQAATIYYVDASAPAGGDGASWATAFQHPQAALDVAQSGDEIRVGKGTYKPTKMTASPNPRSATFALFVGIAFKGGYAGYGATDPDSRDFVADETILSGDFNNDDGAGFANTTENAYHVITSYSQSATVDGFTVCGGCTPDSSGGGILASGSISVLNCTIRNNFAARSGGGLVSGGGNCTVYNCVLRDNRADYEYGGGICASNGVFTKTVFINNYANQLGGGAMFNVGGTVRDCAFYGNSCSGIGGGLSLNSGYGGVFNCVFSGNTGDGVGFRYVNPGEVTGCTFFDNGTTQLKLIDTAVSCANSVLWGGTTQVTSDAGSYFSPTYCCIQGWVGGGAGNITTDPLFVNPLGADGIAGTEDDNLRLQAGSPCIDAGNNAAVPSGVTTDLAGNRRFDNDTSVTDTGSGTAPIVDMGAYERAFKPWAVADSATVHHGAAVTIPVLANDVTLDGGALSITGITQGTHGSVVINGDKVVYTADLNFSGTDGFTYTVTVGAAPPDTGTVTVNVTNTAPVADGQTVSTHWGTAKAVTLTGNDADNDSITFSIVADPQHGTLSGAIPNLTYTPTGAYVGGDSFTFKVNDGAADSNVATVSIDVTNTTPVADGQTVSPHSGTAKAITLTGGDADGDAITFAVVAQPQHGALSGTVPNLTYTPTAGYAGSDSFTFKVNDGVADSNVATVSIDVTNTAPAVTTSASPTSVIPGGTVVFSADGTDPDGDALSYSWDFGDGTTSSEQSPTHAYAAAGVYTATVTVTDSAGATGSASVTIQVSKAPTVRLTTSDVVAFGGNPFTFDAGASTDPENAIASYTWDFGDGTPPGAGQVISKVYDSPGEYTVTLTVTDAAGVSTTLTRVIQVLSADEMGLFSGFVTYQVRWDRNKTNKDSLSLSASVNVGDTVVGPDTLVALEIAGLRFTGTLDKKLRDYSNANAKWQVKAGQRKQPYGAVLVKVKIKNASLGEGFNLAGAHVGADPTDTVSVDIPAKIEIGDRSFEVVVPSDFDFNNDGTKAKGNGEF